LENAEDLITCCPHGASTATTHPPTFIVLPLPLLSNPSRPPTPLMTIIFIPFYTPTQKLFLLPKF